MDGDRRDRRRRARAGAPAALFDRFTSQGEADFADKMLSAMRKQFGGHDEKKGTRNGPMATKAVPSDTLRVLLTTHEQG